MPFSCIVSSLFTISDFVVCRLSQGMSLAKSKCHTSLFLPAVELLGLWVDLQKNCLLLSFDSSGSVMELCCNCLNVIQ